MNEERAIKVLQEQIEKYGQEYDAEGIEALEIAIKALEQTRWIPVSERLPEMYEEIGILKKYVSMKSDEVIVTIRDNKNGSVVTHSKCYLWDGKWHGDIFDWLKASKVDYEVIAWMPLPQSYKAESEGDTSSVEVDGTLTNGDMIKAMFPNVEVKEKNNGYEVYFGVGTAVQYFNHQWWNAQYKMEDEVKPHKICYYCYYYGSDIRPECVKCRQKFDVK